MEEFLDKFLKYPLFDHWEVAAEEKKTNILQPSKP